MKKIFLKSACFPAIIFLLLFSGISFRCEAQYPTDSVQISLLTASPGTEIYALYGHSAIRIFNSLQGTDIVYNFGVFDFDTPNFAIKFTNGRLLYQLAKSSFNNFIYEYEQSGQTVYQQNLNFSHHEKWQLINNLEVNYLPQNRYYRYDFFHDNCATRIRNIIAKSVDGTIQYDSSYIKKPETFRDLIKIYQKPDPWLDFGTHLLIGADADSTLKITDYMFLPGPMMDIYAHSYIVSKGNIRPVTQSTVALLPGTLKPETPDPITSPLVILGLIFILVLSISFWGYRKNTHFKIIDQIILLLTGLLGLFILLVWVGSAHEVLSRNYNIIWASPLYVVFFVMLFYKAPPKWVAKASLVYGLLLILFIIISIFIPQSIPAAAYMIMGILIVRLVKVGLYFK